MTKSQILLTAMPRLNVHPVRTSRTSLTGSYKRTAPCKRIAYRRTSQMLNSDLTYLNRLYTVSAQLP